MEKMTLNEAMAYLEKRYGRDNVLAKLTIDYEGFLSDIKELTGIEFEPTTVEGN